MIYAMFCIILFHDVFGVLVYAFYDRFRSDLVIH